MTIANPNDPLGPQDPKTVVRFGEQLWSTQVGMAEAAAGDGMRCKPEIAYEFTGSGDRARRSFVGKKNPYE